MQDYEYIKEFNRELPEDMEYGLKQQWKRFFLRRDSLVIGAAILIFIAVQAIIGTVITFLTSSITLDEFGKQCIDALTYVLYMIVPTVVMLLVAKREKSDLLYVAAPNRQTFFPVLLLGLGAIPVLQYAAQFINTALSAVNLNTYEPLLEQAFSPVTQTPALIIQGISTVILAALLEELAFRGVMFRMLSRYGNGVAIVCTGVMFGLIHANTYQIPFAMLFGFVLGAAVAYTGSIWTAIILHATNNLYSFALSIVYEKCSESMAEVVDICTICLLAVLGALGIIITVITRGDGRYKLPRAPYQSESSKKGYGVFFSSPTVIISIIFVAISAIMLTDMVMEPLQQFTQYGLY